MRTWWQRWLYMRFKGRPLIDETAAWSSRVDLYVRAMERTNMRG